MFSLLFVYVCWNVGLNDKTYALNYWSKAFYRHTDKCNSKQFSKTSVEVLTWTHGAGVIHHSLIALLLPVGPDSKQFLLQYQHPVSWFGERSPALAPIFCSQLASDPVNLVAGVLVQWSLAQLCNVPGHRSTDSIFHKVG